MKEIGKKFNKPVAAILIILALSGLIISSHLVKSPLKSALDFVEFKIYDLRVRTLAHSRLRSQDITLVLVRQECLEWAQAERGWGWPWPRQAYAEFLDYMNLSEANSVIFDMMYTEPSVYRHPQQDEIVDNLEKNIGELEEGDSALGEQPRAVTQPRGGGQPREGVSQRRETYRELRRNIQLLQRGQDDAFFARAAENYGRVVLGVFFSTQNKGAVTWPEDLHKPLFNTEVLGDYASMFDLRGDGEDLVAQFPIKELREAAGVVGNVTGQSDTDGYFRRSRLFTLFDGKAVPGLSAGSLLASGHEADISYDPKKKIIQWGDFSIPIDDEGKTLLRFRGPIHQYPIYPISEVLKSAEDYAAGREPFFIPEDFAGSNVFFGVYAPGLFDVCTSPISSVYPGIGIHITMLDNMLQGDFISKAPDWIGVLLIIASIVLMVILVFYSGRVAVTVMSLVIALAAICTAGFLSYHMGYWMPMAAPIIALLTAYLSSTIYNFATEGKDKRFIKGAFSRILSPKVIDQIIADPSQLKLGGEKRKMTAIFTDIQRFSTISSELQDQYGGDGPKVLVNLLNLYLTEMSNIILGNGGTIDKYEGDAIIAFFGAPAFMPDHAAMACRSAVQMKRREMEIVETIMNPDGEFYKPLSNLIESKAVRKERPLYTRLGINTGDMVVGFMGTPAKMDYTIMGNAVNLAARLEGVNKQYDTHGILISEYTKDQIGNGFIVRPLSRVTVVGIPVPLRLYELLELREDASPEMLKMIEAWEDAFKDYESRNFEKAKKIFTAIYQKYPDDKVAKLYLDRCDKYIVDPPPESMGGVDNLTEK